MSWFSPSHTGCGMQVVPSPPSLPPAWGPGVPAVSWGWAVHPSSHPHGKTPRLPHESPAPNEKSPSACEGQSREGAGEERVFRLVFDTQPKIRHRGASPKNDCIKIALSITQTLIEAQCIISIKVQFAFTKGSREVMDGEGMEKGL